MYADNGRKLICRDILIDIRDCPKATPARIGRHQVSTRSGSAASEAAVDFRFETRWCLHWAAADKVWGQIITAN